MLSGSSPELIAADEGDAILSGSPPGLIRNSTMPDPLQQIDFHAHDVVLIEQHRISIKSVCNSDGKILYRVRSVSSLASPTSALKPFLQLGRLQCLPPIG